ncbi:hypothetical protein [Klebsiella pneumoniae]|uniref:hypothetical protein n=1 Tax=Klebsiella pneumoniae TaxID=573 RepID=UPI0032AF62B9
MIDGLYDGHIASNKLRMTYCKLRPASFSVSNSGKEFVRAAPGHFAQFFRSCCHLRFFLEEAKAFLRFFFGEL